MPGRGTPRPKPAARTAEGCRADFITVDIRDEAAVQAMTDKISAQYGRLDVLIHTAGVLEGAYISLDEFSPETFQRVIEINVTGTFLVVKHVVPLLRKSAHGVVIVTSSGAATGGSSSFAYGASKGAVNSLGDHACHPPGSRRAYASTYSRRVTLTPP